MKKTIIKNVIILILLPVVGLILMLAVHLLPTDRMKQNVYSSRDQIISEFTDELIIDDYKATLTGNFTDSLMLEFAVYDSPHSVIEQVMNMYRSESCPDEEGWWPGQSLIDYLGNVEQQREIEYSRYWHGYLVFLKPLLMYTSVNTLRLFNSALQLILLAFLLILYTKKGQTKLAISFAVSMPFMFFFSSFASFSLSICMYILLIGLTVQIFFDERLSKNGNYITYFIILGAVTAYFDFLTYPLVTLAYPICVCLCLHEGKFSKQIKDMAVYAGTWALGYVYMWASKWVFAFVLTGNDTVENALLTVKTRTGSADGGNRILGYVQVLKNNLSHYINRAFLPIVLICFLAIAVMAFKYGIGKYIKNLKNAFGLFVIALSPFAWWFVTSNHSVQHGVFTCRIFAVTVFAIMTAFIGALEKGKKK